MFSNVFTGGISDVLIELHKAVLQSIRNGKILHSDKMKEAISENIKRAQIINNQLERKMLSTRKMLEKEKKSPGLLFKAILRTTIYQCRRTEHSILPMTTGGGL